jgi:hypothetical protein
MDEAPSLAVKRSSSYQATAVGEKRKREQMILLPFASILVPDRKVPDYG